MIKPASFLKIGISLGLVIALLGHSQTKAQSLSSSINTSQLSDQQIMMLWQQAQRSGMSESDAIKQLLSRGLAPSEVTNFKKRLIKIQGASQGKSGVAVKDTAAFLSDSSWIGEVPLIKRKTRHFGFDFFNNANVSFEPNLSAPPPANYVLGPGDALSLSLTGLNETTISDKISREGNFTIPYVGIINLSGLTISQALEKIRKKMSTAYPALANGKTQLFLTIDNIKKISVTIIGEAENPGTFTVSGLAGFFNVLYLSGGPSQNGSLRKIELIRNNRVIEKIDFYDFLLKGLFPKDLKLENQDIIRFPVYEKRVSISGEVKRPAIYELQDKETLADLIRFAGGFGDTAFRNSLKIIQIGDQEKRILDLDASNYNNFIPHNADSVFIDKILARFSNKVVLSGAVMRPGDYELTEGLTLSALIKKAQGLREDAFINHGFIKRKKTEDAEREMLSFDPGSVLKGQQDIRLIKEDSVFIPAKDSLQDISTVTVSGSVRTPGIFQFRKGISIEDAIMMAGGFTNDAATHKVEISRLEKNKADTLANKLIDRLTVDVDSSLQNNGTKRLLQPLDYIFVPRLLNYRNLGNIKLRGEILYTGDYALERRDETVRELIGRAGGLTPYASIANIQIYRNNLRVATTVFSENNDKIDKFLLLPGDSIFIPRDEPFVEIKGAVFNPQVLRYSEQSFMSYLSDVGGVTDSGNLKKAYVQYSNGVNRKIRHFLFFRRYPRVLPGSKIIVPAKIPGETRGLSIVELSALTGILTGVVSMVALLKK